MGLLPVYLGETIDFALLYGGFTRSMPATGGQDLMLI
jgi:hypothetical protein